MEVTTSLSLYTISSIHVALGTLWLPTFEFQEKYWTTLLRFWFSSVFTGQITKYILYIFVTFRVRRLNLTDFGCLKQLSVLVLSPAYRNSKNFSESVIHKEPLVVKNGTVCVFQ